MSTVAVQHDVESVYRLGSRDAFTRVIAMVVLIDAAMIVAAIPSAVYLKFGPNVGLASQFDWFTGYPIIDFGFIAPTWLVTLVAFDAYSKRHFARGSDDIKVLLKASVTAAAVVAMGSYLINYDMSRGFFLYTFVIGTGLLLVGRYLSGTVVSRLRTRGRLLHRVVAFGGEAEVLNLYALLNKRPEVGYEIVAASLPTGAMTASFPVPVVGSDEVTAACRAFGADTLLVAGGSPASSDELRRIGWELADADIDLIVVPSLIDIAGPRIHMRPVTGLPFLHIEPPHVDRAMTWGKAIFDRLGAAVLLLLLAPVLIAVAAAVRMNGRGPVFFGHLRVGADGREFRVWKFRSMVHDAEDLHKGLMQECGLDPLLFKLKDDPRVTPVGRFIRRYSLDELPQLINVLMGEMSLVGPRPQVPAEVAQYADADHRRLLVRPGITGLWQISGRSDLTWEEAVRLDLYYIDNWSMVGDLVILAKTLSAVIRPQGAY